jgi:tRNA nucleotidyltransferase (CCA-adding enzyme)
MKSSANLDQYAFSIPREVAITAQILIGAGYEAYLIGGCTRDLILGRKPKDWDITTNATPEQIISLFPKTFYENTFGTVGVVDENTQDETLKIIEVTPYRTETTYSDYRRPDSVSFSTKLTDDIERRDFTVNAIAMGIKDGKITEIIDFYKGQDDIKDKILRTVGKPEDRFKEDALRMVRAVRLAAELGFTINTDAEKAILEHSELLKHIAIERIRDEFNKILMSNSPREGIIRCQKLGILRYIIPELEQGMGIEQRGTHEYDVYNHLLYSLEGAAGKGWPLEIRLAALLHDISKPETRRVSHETGTYTFYGHEVVGSRVTQKILERMHYPKKTIEKIVKLVRWHMFFTDTESITLSAVRRMIVNVGRENIWDLMNLRICDRIGTGRPKEDPYRLRKYKAMIEEALHDPVTVGMLKIDGTTLIKELNIAAGPTIGLILNALLEEVIENPQLNTKEFLMKRSQEMLNMKPEELKEMAEKGRNKKEEIEKQEIDKIRSKYHVS